tara:strand:+ start:178 stop:840 length:663 start_codon:yes stop_codon:yes gene_type:complete
MAVSYQTWEWSNIEESETSGPSQRIPMNGRAITLVANQPYDMFVGTVGNQTSIPPATRATQFIVLEDMGVTPTNGSSLQVVVNTTSYFEDPDGAVSQGVPAKAIPYPCGATPFDTGSAASNDGSAISIPSFKLNPPLYILPGQSWTMQYFSSQGVLGGGDNGGGTVGGMIYYMQYDGVDALVANSLMEMGVPVNLDNLDWYKQQALTNNLKSLTQTGGAN